MYYQYSFLISIQWLKEVFLEYFKEWKEEINGLDISKNGNEEADTESGNLIRTGDNRYMHTQVCAQSVTVP